MKLIRFGPVNQEKTGIVIDDIAYDTSALGEDYNENFFETGGLQRLMSFISSNNGELPRVAAGTRLGSPVARPSKIVCVGLNYLDHARETNSVIPTEPILFLKSTTALCGPFDDIIIPKNSQKTDWEVELAVVIGKKASYVETEDAHLYIAGYCLHNDVSERAFQLEKGGTWDKGKGCDSFAPMGPWLVTPEEIADVNNLRLWLKVNDVVRQESNSSNLIFNIPFLISYISQFMTLLPGDIISTGTPHGVGMGLRPAVYLKDGDVVELGIDGLGVSKQQAKAYASN